MQILNDISKRQREYESTVIDMFERKLNLFSNPDNFGVFIQFYLDNKTYHYTTIYHINELGLHDIAVKVSDNCYRLEYERTIYDLSKRNNKNYTEYLINYKRYRESTDIDFFNISVPEYSYNRKKEVWKSVMGNVIKRDESGLPLMTVGVLCNICNVKNDITDFLDGNNILKQYLDLFNKVEVVGGIGTFYMNLSDNMNKFWASDNYAKMFGMSLRSDNTYDLDIWKKAIYTYNKESGDKVIKKLNDFLDGKSKELLITYDILVKGKRRIIKSHAIAQKRDSNRRVLLLLGSTKDVTDIKEKEYELEKMVYTDSLTGLFNESKFNKDYNDQLLPYNSLLFLDINKFKQINDNYGHQFGDIAIKSFTERIKNTLQDLQVNDYIMYRIYGDEFIINLNFDEERFRKYEAKEIVYRLFNKYIIDDTEIDIKFSMGVLTNFNINEKLEDIFRKIDVAMYIAKRNDKWYHIKDANKKDIEDEEYFLELRIKTDLKEENIIPFFQPIYDINSTKINSFEALARVKFDDTIITPNKFIDVAKRRGLLSFIDFTILEKSIHTLIKLTDEGIITNDVKVAVNFSMNTLSSSKLFKVLKRIKKETNFDYNRLKIELTESEITEMLKKEDIITKLKSLGIHIVMDDFSAGNSSINTLAFDSMQTIKLDRKFLWEAMLNDDIKSMYKYFVLMFNKKRLEIVAEGVETIDQVKFLKQIGVSNLQGYALSLPLANDNLKHILNKNSSVIEEVNQDYQKSYVAYENMIPSYNYEIDDNLQLLWKSYLDQAICSSGFNSALITRINDDKFELFCKNTNDATFELNHIFEDRNSVLHNIINYDGIFYVDDIRKYDEWNDKELFTKGSLSCIATSLKWPDGKYFGALMFLGRSISKSKSKMVEFTKMFIEEQLKQVKLKIENLRLKDKLNNTSTLLKSIAKVGQVGMYILDTEDEENNYYNDELISILGIKTEDKYNLLKGGFPHVADDESSKMLLDEEANRVKAILQGKLTKATGIVKIYNKRINSMRFIKTSREVVDFREDGLPKKVYCVVTDVTDVVKS